MPVARQAGVLVPQQSSRLRPWLELAAALLLAGGGYSVARATLTLQAHAEQSSRTLAVGLAQPGTELGSLEGVDLNGRIVLQGPGHYRRFVAFVVRPATAQADLTLWRTVAGDLAGANWIKFEAYCQAGDCSSTPPLPGAITLLQAGEVRTAEATLNADRAGESLLIASDARILKRIPWRGRRPLAVATAIAAAR